MEWVVDENLHLPLILLYSQLRCLIMYAYDNERRLVNSEQDPPSLSKPTTSNSRDFRVTVNSWMYGYFRDKGTFWLDVSIIQSKGHLLVSSWM